MSNPLSTEPDIYVIKWTGNTRPGLNHIHSNRRSIYKDIVKNGNILFILCEDEHIYEWGQWRQPVFLTWNEFMKFYREYNIKFV